MACRDAYKTYSANPMVEQTPDKVDQLLFGADTAFPANDLLQNNIDLFEWIVRNKIYPVFIGRYINGENCLTLQEIHYLRDKGCKIAAILVAPEETETQEQGQKCAELAAKSASALKIPVGTCIFLEIYADVLASTEFMKGYAQTLLECGYTPGFMANTDAKYSFDREFSRGMQMDSELFRQCLIWAVSPTLEEYNGMTTSHLIHPDNWGPFAPSAIKRRQISIWQFGEKCHPIEDDQENETCFNLNLVRNVWVILEKMF